MNPFVSILWICIHLWSILECIGTKNAPTDNKPHQRNCVYMEDGFLHPFYKKTMVQQALESLFGRVYSSGFLLKMRMLYR